MTGVDDLARRALDAVAHDDARQVAHATTALVQDHDQETADAARVVGLVRAFAERVPDADVGADRADDMLSGLHATAVALERVQADGSDLLGGSCRLGPALLALANHLTGRIPHHRPDTLGATPASAAASAEVLSWSHSGDAVERLVAGLTAPDRDLVEPLVDDPDVLVRTAARLNRCMGRERSLPPEGQDGLDPFDLCDARPVHGAAALTRLREDLEGSDLDVPAIAARSAEAGELTRWGPWRYASAPLPDPFQDYAFSMSAAALRGPVRQQLAINHAGHGANSYSLNLRLAVGPVAIMAQTGWGGAYGGRDDDDRWALLAEGVDLLTHGIALTSDGRLERRRWLVLDSDFRLGRLPVLLRRDGDRWVLPWELEDAVRRELSSGPRTLDHVADRWVLIHNIVEQDLYLHERILMPSDVDVTIPDPSEPTTGNPLEALVDPDGQVIGLRFDADDDMLERRHGCWERIDHERSTLLADVRWLAHVDSEHIGPHVAPQAIARFDVAELAGVRLPLATLLGEPAEE